MGRKTKDGLLYFQADIALYNDDKFIMAQDIIDPELKEPLFRFLVPHIAVRLLAEIYNNGYFIFWNNTVSLELSAKKGFVGGVSNSMLKKFVHALVECGFFNKEMFNNYSILTSSGIQKRWDFIVKRLNRKNNTIKKEYNLLPNGGEIYGEKLKNEIPFKDIIENEKVAGNKENSQGNKENSQGNKENSTFSAFPYNNNNTSSIDNNKEVNSNKDIIVISKSGGKSEESGKEMPKSGGKSEESGKEMPKSGGKSEDDVYEINNKNKHLPHPISACLWNYLNNNVFSRSKEMHLFRLGLHDDPKIANELIAKWAYAFNRSLINDGKFELSMTNGTEAWVSYFPNWVKKVINSRQGENIDPDVLFTKNDKIKNANKNNHVNLGDQIKKVPKNYTIPERKVN